MVNAAAAGVLLSVLAGVMLGAFALPMKKVRTWGWEHTWLVFSLLALIVMPLAAALATIPDLWRVWAETDPSVLLAVAGFAALWGFASIGYGLSVKLAGIAIANAVVLGLNNAIGSILPIILYHPGEILTARGLGVTAGVLVMMAGIAISARAGFLRDKSRADPAGASAEAAKTDSKKGLIICFVSGVIGSAFNFALISGKPIERIAVAHGASTSAAPNATWPVALSAGCLVAIIYCVFLMIKNRNGRAYFAAGTGINWVYSFVMAFLWFGGVMVYGSAVTRLGELGASVGWAILQSMTVATGAALGFATGEWKGVARKTVALLLIGLLSLILGIVIVVTAGTQRSP
jgi:L-rhamnose-H+ transport protein